MITDSYVLRTGEKLNLNCFKISHLSRKEQAMKQFIKRFAVACELTIHHQTYQMMSETKTELQKVLQKLK